MHREVVPPLFRLPLQLESIVDNTYAVILVMGVRSAISVVAGPASTEIKDLRVRGRLGLDGSLDSQEPNSPLLIFDVDVLVPATLSHGNWVGMNLGLCWESGDWTTSRIAPGCTPVPCNETQQRVLRFESPPLKVCRILSQARITMPSCAGVGWNWLECAGTGHNNSGCPALVHPILQAGVEGMVVAARAWLSV